MTTGQIYWGAVPFVCIQVIMIGLTIAFPQMVMHYKGAGRRSGHDRDPGAGNAGLVAARHAASEWQRAGRWRRGAGCSGHRPVATAELR